MIPLYPPRQGEPRIHLVKWKSLVSLVSHQHEEHTSEAPRVRSLSTIVFLPSSRKHSTSSQKASSTRNESFIPDFIRHRSRSSSIAHGDEAEQKASSAQKGVEALSHPSTSASLGAKNKVQRLKAGKEATVAGKESTRPNFFKKKDRKAYLVGQSSVDVALPPGSELVHGAERTGLLIAPVELGDAKKSTEEQTILCAEVKVIDKPDRPTQEEVIVVVDPATLPTDSTAKGASTTGHPAQSLAQSSKASSQTVPRVAKKKSTGIQLLSQVFHRKRSTQQNPISDHKPSQQSTTAAYGMVICGGSDELHQKYRGRIEKVKFGVPIHEAFVHDIPATLLVNKEGPLKKDIWRAPGNQAQVRKLANIMQHGRLVNISNISVYTAASVIKKFLSKLPGGIFGAENEQILFNSFQSTINDEQRQTFCRVVCSLPLPSQHLLVLLFGTFRIIADSAQTFNTRMTPDAIGISVAPSLFLTCMHDEHRAKLEDIVRFKAASQIISKIIQSFGYTNLFTRECYEFYARITGRTLRVDESYQFSFVYPSRTFSQPSICFAQTSAAESGTEQDQPGPSGLQRQPTTSSRRRSDETEGDDVYSDELPGSSRFAHPRRDRAASASGANDPQLHHSGYWRHPSRDPFSDLFDQSKLSTSMGEVLLHSEYERAIGESLSDRPSGQPSPHSAAMSSRCAESLESTRSLTYLEWVHEKQTKRMKSRSEWFLSPAMPPKNGGASKSFDFHSHFQHSPSPMHQKLRLPETDTDRSLQSSTEEIMRTGSSYSSGKEQRPVSPILIVESSLEPMDKKLEEAVVLSGETTPRLPFQMLQHHSGESDDAPLSATPPARQQPPMFFAEDAPPTKTSKSDSSSGSQSQKSILIGPSATTQSQQQSSSTGGLTRVSSIGVVRRKSWRTHYVRPNKSLDQESAPKEEVGLTSHSTPAASTRRSSANGDSNTKLIRRKSSSNSAQSSKVPVQARLSTQI